MSHQLTWHGHANFQIASPGVNILIDPFFTGNPTCTCQPAAIERPDLVLVTHDHGDHVGQAVEICQATGAMLGAVVGTAAKLQRAGLPAKQLINGNGFNIGGAITWKMATVVMTQAFHSSDSGVAAGYIIVLADGFTIYHAGDTGIFSSMALWGQLYPMDLALLPIGGVFTMDPRQAALACTLLGCRAVAPMHWGTFPALEKNTAEFKRHLADMSPDTQLLDLSPGQTVTLQRPVDTCGCEATA